MAIKDEGKTLYDCAGCDKDKRYLYPIEGDALVVAFEGKRNEKYYSM